MVQAVGVVISVRENCQTADRAYDQLADG